MRLKPLPEPPVSVDAVEENCGYSIANRTVFDTVADAQAAVPLVPASENDCCGRLMRREGYQSRDVAREWLTFLRALELAAETESGFKRMDREPTPENVRESFRKRVFGAADALAVLQAVDGPLSAESVFERLRETVPGWERQRRRTWVEHWQERTEKLLDWLVLLNLATKTDDGYVCKR